MKTTVDLSGLPVIEQPGRIAIIQSKWYPEVVESLSSTCVEVLTKYGYSQIEVHTVPGSLELPLAARDLLALDVNKEIDAIICFGSTLR